MRWTARGEAVDRHAGLAVGHRVRRGPALCRRGDRLPARLPFGQRDPDLFFLVVAKYGERHLVTGVEGVQVADHVGKTVDATAVNRGLDVRPAGRHTSRVVAKLYLLRRTVGTYAEYVDTALDRHSDRSRYLPSEVPGLNAKPGPA